MAKIPSWTYDRQIAKLIHYLVILNLRHLHFLHSDRGMAGTIRK